MRSEACIADIVRGCVGMRTGNKVEDFAFMMYLIQWRECSIGMDLVSLLRGVLLSTADSCSESNTEECSHV